jgi:hypothetical protein
MMEQLVQRILAKFKPGSVGNGRRKSVDPTQALAKSYENLLRLAGQIESHGEKAPYPHIALQLRQIAREKREFAEMMKQRMGAAQEPVEEIHAAIKSGKNHWERMVQDLQDHKSLDEELNRVADLWAERSPETSRLLREITALQGPHKDKLLDLIARADPQAYQY